VKNPRCDEQVLVGVDGRPCTADALDWSAAEAAARRCRLRIVHAFHWTITPDPYGLLGPFDTMALAREAAEQLLAEAVSRARVVAPDTTVSAHLALGTAKHVLAEESHDAQLLVVGGREPGSTPGTASTAVSRGLLGCAHCPVVAIRHRAAPQPARTSPRVVLGVDDPGRATAATRFAFQAAAQRGLPLVVVHAHRPTGPSNTPGWEVAALDSIERSFADYRTEFPDVSVHVAIASGDPVATLTALSRDAALLVVGSAARGGLLTLGRRSITNGLLDQATTPLAILPRRVVEREPQSGLKRAHTGSPVAPDQPVDSAEMPTDQPRAHHRRRTPHHPFSRGQQ
jgi:nucleotide-binding universal stress UspA family protein